jgi:general secretion pathway protein G
LRNKNLSPPRPGFTLIEMMIVSVIVGLLAALAIPNLSRAREKAMVVKAIGDVKAIQQEITEYSLDHSRLPSSLADIGRAGMLDPWGHAYVYLPITKGGKGGFRKDRFLVPLNSDYDLYSMGADGASTAPLSAKNSQDDIIRANDGGFVGLASDF